MNSAVASPASQASLDEIIDKAIQVPRPGTSFALPALAGSSDSLLVARLAGRSGTGAGVTRRTLAVVAAAAPDAQRLAEEVA